MTTRRFALLKAHREAQKFAKRRAGTAWQDNDLIFCHEVGSPWRPDHIYRRFRAIAAAAGLPVIKLHEGRHSVASLQRDAEVDPRAEAEPPAAARIGATAETEP